MQKSNSGIPKMIRDDLKKDTKITLALRAGTMCSKPGCDKTCFLPGSEPDKKVNIGVAAHIKAASGVGPRYDPDQSAEERRFIENAIFLYRDHATLIDQDPEHYPAGILA